MELYVKQHPEDRQIAVCSTNYALIFQCVNNQIPSCAIQLKPKSFVLENCKKSNSNNKNSNFFQKLSFHDIYGFIGLIELNNLIFIACITGKTKVAQPIPHESVNKIFAVDFFCLNDPKWDFVEIDSNGYPILQTNDDNGASSSKNNTNNTPRSASNTLMYEPDVELQYRTNSGGFTTNTSNHSAEYARGTNNVSNNIIDDGLLAKHPCHDLRKLLSSGSFYYSSDFDLTSTLQNRGGLKNNHSLSLDHYEEEYMWNSFLMQEVISFRDRLSDGEKDILDEEGFLTTVIRGFAETYMSYVNKLKVSLTVISKQSWKRAGTRYNARGIDDDGNVANFVETEFVMYSKEYCFAFTEVRGSVPVFWEQDTSILNPKVSITRSVEATQPTFDEHFNKLCSKYGPVDVVNLLSTKSSEIELTRRYRKHIKNSKYKDNIFLTEFDFHKETATEGFSAAVKLKPLIQDFLLDSGYFSYDVVEGKTLSEQHGVFRVNCLDCLDRTNLIQQFISNLVFKLFLQDFKLLKSKSTSMFDEEIDCFIKHNTLWADNGDQISQIYTGTNALKSSFSRKGKMSFAGALADATKSVSRIYINNFMDKDKQNNIDKLLGKLPNQLAVQLYDPMMEYVSSQLAKVSDQYTLSDTINLLIGTYNVNGITRKSDLSKWLYPIGDKFQPDIVVLGLQEVIELTAGSLLNADYSKRSIWVNMVNDCLNQYSNNTENGGDKYMMLRAEQMTSLMILFFVRADKVNNVKQVEGGSKKTGFGGIAGNKGAVAIRFNYGETSFCFVNSHLAAGVSNFEERRIDFESIMKNVKFTRGKTIPIHDNIFWLGDLNYRIDLPNEEVRKVLSDKNAPSNLSKLLQYDQLTQEINAGVVFKGFKEPTIRFPPTYKYDLGTDLYDTSEKARTPSWTDRILYNGKNLRPLSYSDVCLHFSDHKPVYAAYRSKVEFVNQNKKDEFIDKFKKDYKVLHPNESAISASSLLIEEEEEKEAGEKITNNKNKQTVNPLGQVLSAKLPISSTSTINSKPVPPPRKSGILDPKRSENGKQLPLEINLLDLDIGNGPITDSTSSVSSPINTISDMSFRSSTPPLVPLKPKSLSSPVGSNASGTSRITDSSLNTNKTATANTTETTSITNVNAPPTPPAPRHTVSMSTLPDDITHRPEPPLNVKLPPGFSSESILKPKKDISPPKVPFKNPDLSVAKDTNTTASNKGSTPKVKKNGNTGGPPTVLAKKPELSMDAWKPLSPK
ncbi:related to Polyphosphatidylinositol phosphatase INP52 [Saccharomycodes ludwigii]|uniref:phosphoinositide 5-phosphatase n=1 Tax=Saccharomycodes ludwigii TaxID=36035 RepID=A0A376B379_9ASCO|nr:related to Polyphosphatidylinositol phosphatase INP52 [Saccharomycodes ludwigii]